MGTLYLVRHGQASFGTDDYDQLSALGKRQSVRLGHYFARKDLHFDAILSGTLRRHTQTLAGISEGLGVPLTAVQWPGLNEYDSRAIIGAIHPAPLEPASPPDQYRHYFRLLRVGLTQWMLGKTQPIGMPDWRQFQQGVIEVLDYIRQTDAQQVLLVSSGGPIACAIGHVLATPSDATVELNMRLRNSSVTEFAFTPKYHALQTFNTLPHLDALEFDAWVTYA